MAAAQSKGTLGMLADLLQAAYPDTDGHDRCPYCGSNAISFTGIRLRLSQIGHDFPCRWLEARENVAAARRTLLYDEDVCECEHLREDHNEACQTVVSSGFRCPCPAFKATALHH